MHEILVDVLVFAITVATIVVTRNVVPYIKNLIKDSQYADILDIVELAVKSAEQIYKQPKQGKAKKADVYKYVTGWLNARGIRLTEEDIDRLIEACVFTMNNEG